MKKIPALCLAALLVRHSYADVATDSSFGAAGALPGPNFAIPASLGKKVGGNLFHSFSEFSIASGESATFSGPADVTNILSRVTGGKISTIDGMLKSEITGANFYFLNPKGVIFGPNAALDVSGSFNVSTGDHIALEGGARFKARSSDPSDALLTSVRPAAFGFLSEGTGPIELRGSNLQPPGGLALVGGEVRMTNANTFVQGNVVIRGGKLTMTGSSVFAGAATPSDRIDIKLRGALQLADGSQLISGAFQGGGVRVTASSITIGGAGSGIKTFSSGNAGGIQLDTGGEVRLFSGGVVQASGGGGNISVHAAAVSVTGANNVETGISADTSSDVRGGDVRLDVAGALTIASGGKIGSETFGPGAGGNVLIGAQSLRISGENQESFTAISTETQGAIKGGRGGNVRLAIRGPIELTGGGKITAATAGTGDGGNIDIAANSIRLVGQGAEFLTGITARSENKNFGGNAGSVRLNISGALEILGGATVAASTAGPGAGGSVEIDAASVALSGELTTIAARTTHPFHGGPGGSVAIRTGTLSDRSGAAISASTAGSGNGGAVSITAKTIDLDGGSITAETTSPDRAEKSATVADLTVKVNVHQPIDKNLTLALRSPDGVEVFLVGGVGADGSDFTQTVFSDRAPVSIAGGTAPFTGRFRPLQALANFNEREFNGGWALTFGDSSIDEGTGEFDPANPARLIDWSLSNRGGAEIGSGTVNLSLPGPLGSSNNISFLTVKVPSAGIFPVTPGIGGNVHIVAENLHLHGGGNVSANTVNAARGGDVLIDAAHLQIEGTPGVSATSSGAGRSGTIKLELGGLALKSGGFIGSSNTGSGDAGSVAIHARDGVFLRGGSLISTSAAKADAGIISIASGTRIELREASSITASAGRDGGNITLAAPEMIELRDSSVTATAGTTRGVLAAGGTGGTGGNISIDPEFILLDHSLISANAAIGQGGNILLRTESFLFSESAITATGATSGSVEIVAPELDLSAALALLSGSLVDASTQLREQCARRLGLDFSSFLVIGRGGVSLAPDEALPASAADGENRAAKRRVRGR